MKKLFFLIFTLIGLGCADKSSTSNVPTSWYQLQEDMSAPYSQSESTLKLTNTVDTIFKANSNALESGLSGEFAPYNFSNEQKPKDWVPWRAEVFTTDLSVTVGGLLGVLATKGTATVRAYWRKQYPKPQASTNFFNPDDKKESEGAILISEESTPAQINKQIDSVVNLAVRANKIPDSPYLRPELAKLAEEFQALAFSLNSTNTDLPWWVQRFRVDFSVDASGHVHPNVTVGGEVRFRFEWHRIKRKNSTPLKVVANHPSSFINQAELQSFVRNMAEDLEQAFSWMPDMDFQAHTVRMGIGISAKGKFGVVKGGAGIVGQIYFTRDVKRPVKYPKPVTKLVAENDSPIYLIEQNPSESHLDFAKKSGVPFELAVLSHEGEGFVDPIKEAVYKLNRTAFRNGLKRAAKITKFFAERAVKQSETKIDEKGKWKIFELRTAFDASVGGELSMATLTGNATAQIAFFNQKF